MNLTRWRGRGAWLVACILLAGGTVPFFAAQRAARRNAARIARVQSSLRRLTAGRLRTRRCLCVSRVWTACWRAGKRLAAAALVARRARVAASNGSVAASTGGAFQLQTVGTYLHLQDGYNLTLFTQISRDLGEKWNVGVAVPMLYKYYRDYRGLPVDISNSGFGDVAAFLTRRFGEINDTSLTLLVGFPTGVHDATYKNGPADAGEAARAR